MAFQNKYTTLRLNGVLYDKQGLLKLVESQKKESPLWQQSLYQFIAEWLNDRAVVDVQTSGSTGTPNFHFKQKQTALLCLPCNYIAGKMMVVRSFVWGLDLQLVEPVGNPMESIGKFKRIITNLKH